MAAVFCIPYRILFVAPPWFTGIEEPIVQGLMHGVAAIVSEFLNLLGIPAQLEGNVIRVNSGLVGVNEACSGVRSLQTSLMIGLLFGERARLDRAAFMALGVSVKSFAAPEKNRARMFCSAVLIAANAACLSGKVNRPRDNRPFTNCTCDINCPFQCYPPVSTRRLTGFKPSS